jgi:hypothetical protein
MEPQAAGVYRRTQAERDDQLLSWQRGDRAFFAAGACHILAWTCRELYPGRPIGIAGFCRRHHHRMPDQYYRNPRPRARDYLRRFDPPWMPG